MLDFRPITTEDLPKIVPYLSGNGAHFCDFSPVNLYIWSGLMFDAYAVVGDTVVFRLKTWRGRVAYTVPMGAGDIRRALHCLQEETQSLARPLIFSLVSVDDLPLLREVFGELSEPRTSENWRDYIYDAHKMAAYEGSAYAKQRNHVRRFCRNYPEHRVEALEKRHLPEVEALLARFPAQRGKTDDDVLKEVERTNEALHRMDELMLFGVVLYVGDQLVGVSAGSRVGDMLFVNFEKADTAFDGVYQMLVQAFAQRYVDDDIRYINREEDCGDEGIRKSKLAYHPIDLLAKYTVEVLV